VLASLPVTTAWLTRHYAHRTAAIRTKWIMLILFGLVRWLCGRGVKQFCRRTWSAWCWRERCERYALDPPVADADGGFSHTFYFLRAGTLVSLPALLAAPLVFIALLTGKVASKIFGLYPFISVFRQDRNERWYYTLLMSTGLTFGTISSLYGLAHGLVTQEQYSFLVAAVIASAVVPRSLREWLLSRRISCPGRASGENHAA